MRKSGVEEWLVQAVMALYIGVRTMLGHEEVRCEEWLVQAVNPAGDGIV